jgi:hypothetical protein
MLAAAVSLLVTVLPVMAGATGYFIGVVVAGESVKMDGNDTRPRCWA